MNSVFSRFNLIGESPVFCASLKLIEKYALNTANVYIHGETGTGKELAARAIHYLGSRSERPFVPANCGAIPDTLIEDEFFGHKRGAFTDARESRDGLIALAEGGTLFLDEIECLSLKGQVMLLRYLQDRVYRPIGSRELIPSDIRVVVASNQSLDDMVSRSEFRQDLLFRLDIMPLELPPLRHRGADILLLAKYFIDEFSKTYALVRKNLNRGAIERLLSYDWPGNVRELENVIHRAVFLSETEELDIYLNRKGKPSKVLPEDGNSFDLDCMDNVAFNHAKACVVGRFEKAYVERVMAKTHGNVSEAARLVGKDRRAFGRLLKKYGIDRMQYRE